MPRPKEPKAGTTDGQPDGRDIYWAPEGHPSQVSGMFKEDPTFGEFCAILRQQREEDYRQAHEAVDAMMDEEEEATPCSSSTRTPSRTTKTPTPSSV